MSRVSALALRRVQVRSGASSGASARSRPRRAIAAAVRMSITPRALVRMWA